MGSSANGTGHCPDEMPHRVRFAHGFWMLETPVTQKMWMSVMGRNPSSFSGDFDPVENVSWDECQDFCREFSERFGVNVSLPTEAQWEYACRAGSEGAYAGDLDKMGWYHGTFAIGRTAPVKKKAPNAWGLYDMHGNVWEWCADWYAADYYSGSPIDDPQGPPEDLCRVFRGGSWANFARECRSAVRGKALPGEKNWSLGFRIILK
ncbi:MAG: formylglycine-generating enzyme family protein [Planctomycetaceae bacterium]|nr:formylglycine-generating enzyme family protein [Planctomycetaceae bacterium]